METIYLSLRAQVAVGTFFMKSPVCDAQKPMSVENWSDLISSFKVNDFLVNRDWNGNFRILMSSLKYVDGEKVCIWGWSFGGYITGIQQMRYTQHFLNNIRIGYFFSKTLNFSLSDILIRIIIQFLFFIGFVLRILAIILSFLYNFLFFIFKKYLHFFIII